MRANELQPIRQPKKTGSGAHLRTYRWCYKCGASENIPKKGDRTVNVIELRRAWDEKHLNCNKPCQWCEEYFSNVETYNDHLPYCPGKMLYGNRILLEKSYTNKKLRRTSTKAKNGKVCMLKADKEITSTQCPQCDENLSKNDLTAHLEKCDGRKYCSYCDSFYPDSLFWHHQEECKQKYYESLDVTLLTTLDDSVHETSPEVNALPLPNVAAEADVDEIDIVTESDEQVGDTESKNDSSIDEETESSSDDEKLENKKPKKRNYSETKIRQAIKKELKKLSAKYCTSEPSNINLRPKTDAEGNQKERFCSRNAENKSETFKEVLLEYALSLKCKNEEIIVAKHRYVKTTSLMTTPESTPRDKQFVERKLIPDEQSKSTDEKIKKCFGIKNNQLQAVYDQKKNNRNFGQIVLEEKDKKTICEFIWENSQIQPGERCKTRLVSDVLDNVIRQFNKEQCETVKNKRGEDCFVTPKRILNYSFNVLVQTINDELSLNLSRHKVNHILQELFMMKRPKIEWHHMCHCLGKGSNKKVLLSNNNHYFKFENFYDTIFILKLV